MSPRLALARMVDQIFPPVLSNRLTLHYLYPHRCAAREGGAFDSRGVTGSTCRVDLEDVHLYMFAMHGYFDWRVLAVAGAVLAPGDVAVEVGANVGTETVALADMVGPTGKIYAVEPVPSNLDRLRDLKERARFVQLEIVPMAMSDVEGAVEFVLPSQAAHSGIGHLREPTTPASGENQTLRVECTRLDTFLEGAGGRPVRLITIDAEGAEPSILRGAAGCLRRDQPVVIVEACEAHLRRFGGSLSSLQADLAALGYQVHEITRLGLRPPDLTTSEQSNWVALPARHADLAARIRRRLLACGLLPGLRGLNPLSRVAAASAP